MENDSSYDFSHLRVLYVEDTSAFQTMMEGIFKFLKIDKFHIVNNGIEAIEYTYKNDYDVIIIDLEMPYMGGHEAVSIIQNKLEVSTPIYVCSTVDSFTSGNIDNNIYQEAIAKPFQFEDIVKVLEKNTT